MGASLGTARIFLRVDGSRFASGMRAATAQVQTLVKKVDKLGQSLINSGKKFALVGAALTVPFALSIKFAIDAESAFTGVRKTVELTEKEFKKLEARFIEMSKVAPTTFIELAKIGEIAGQLGVQGVDNISKFTRTIADIAVTTNLTAENAATSFARIANVIGEPIENVDRMASAVVDLGNNFATTEAEITTFATRMAGAGRIAGLTTANLFSIGAAMSSVGVEAEAGGTAIQRVLIEMNTAVATSSEELVTFAETAGLTVEEFATLWKKDASDAFRLFVEGLGKQGGKATITLEKLSLNNMRLVRAFLSLGNAGDLLARTLKTGTKAFEENIALTEEAEKRYSTLASQLAITRNKIDSIRKVVGDALTPTLIKLNERLGPILQNAEDFIKVNPKLIQALSTIGPLLTAIGVAAIGLGVALKGLGVTLAFFSGPVGLAVLAILASLGAAYLLLRKHTEAVVNVMRVGWATIQDVIQIARNRIEIFMADMVERFETGEGAIGRTLRAFGSLFSSVFNVIKLVFDSAVQFVKTNWDTITAIFEGGIEFVRIQFEIFKDTFRIAFTIISGVIQGLADAIGIHFGSIEDSVGGSSSTILEIIKDLQDKFLIIMQGIQETVAFFAEFIEEHWDDIVRVSKIFFDTMIGSLKMLVDLTGSSIDLILEAWQFLSNGLDKITKGIANFLDRINPFHRESPSLVDNVRAGMKQIAKIYSDAGKFITKDFGTFTDNIMQQFENVNQSAATLDFRRQQFAGAQAAVGRLGVESAGLITALGGPAGLQDTLKDIIRDQFGRIDIGATQELFGQTRRGAQLQEAGFDVGDLVRLIDAMERIEQQFLRAGGVGEADIRGRLQGEDLALLSGERFAAVFADLTRQSGLQTGPISGGIMGFGPVTGFGTPGFVSNQPDQLRRPGGRGPVPDVPPPTEFTPTSLVPGGGDFGLDDILRLFFGGGMFERAGAQGQGTGPGGFDEAMRLIFGGGFERLGRQQSERSDEDLLNRFDSGSTPFGRQVSQVATPENLPILREFFEQQAAEDEARLIRQEERDAQRQAFLDRQQLSIGGVALGGTAGGPLEVVSDALERAASSLAEIAIMNGGAGRGTGELVGGATMGGGAIGQSPRLTGTPVEPVTVDEIVAQVLRTTAGGTFAVPTDSPQQPMAGPIGGGDVITAADIASGQGGGIVLNIENIPDRDTLERLITEIIATQERLARRR